MDPLMNRSRLRADVGLVQSVALLVGVTLGGLFACSSGDSTTAAAQSDPPVGGSSGRDSTVASGGSTPVASGTTPTSGGHVTAETSIGGGAANAAGGAPSGAGGASEPTTSVSHKNPLTQALIDQFVSEHNKARGGTLNPPPSPALPPVAWDYVLADVAYNYLSGCPGGNATLAPHNANASKDYAALGGTDKVGENIYAASGMSATPAAALATWMKEAASYNYSTNNIGSAGHYTQVVWRDSVRIGCAIVVCPNYEYSNTIVCDYAPAGNIVSKKPY